MQPVKITVKDHVGREAFNRPTPPINCGSSMIDKINEESYAENMIEYNRLVNECIGYPCPELSNTKPSETVEAELVWQERRFGEEWDNIDAPTNESQWTRQIYRLVPKEGKDRTPSPSGGIKTAEEIISEYLKTPKKYLDDREQICVGAAIEAIHAYHNQFAGDGWISVEDRLPEDAGDVLVGDIEHDIVRIGFYNGSWYIPNAPYSDVTHWQPLPSPPQNTKES